MVIQNQEYVYRGNPRVITPSHGNSMRRSSSMTDLDEAFKTPVNHARGAGPFGGSPITNHDFQRLSLGKNIFVTPLPSISQLSYRARSDASDEHFLVGIRSSRVYGLCLLKVQSRRETWVVTSTGLQMSSGHMIKCEG